VTLVGQTVSHYRVLERLGGGGMGVVYRGEDLKLRRTVALKFLPPEWSGHDSAKRRFLQEARAASALDHPNICTIYEIGETEDGQLFIAMALYRGESLKTRILDGPLSQEKAVAIAREIALGLSHAHERGIVHRDVKSANVMITKEGVVKVVDFGVAKLAGEVGLTRAGRSVGTPAYMSPEQARGDEVDARTDLWSLGVVLYEMLSGHLPFPGDHEQAVIHAILNDDPTPLADRCPELPPALGRLVRRTLEKDPGDRHQSASELAEALRLVAYPDTMTAVTASPRRRRTRRSGRAVVSVVSALGMAAALWFGLGGGQPRRVAPGDVGALAVLPFDNLTNDPEQEYLVDGVQDALITKLSKIGSLRIISRTSTMRYKGASRAGRSSPEIARELDVDALVEGSVLRVGDRVRITAQLVDGASDEQLWAESYDRDLKDVLVVLSEVARTIAGEIRIELTPEQSERVAVAPVDPEAQEAYLKGRYYFNQVPEPGFERCLEYFQRATEIEPTFAAAHAMVAQSYFVIGSFTAQSLAELAPRARAAADRALELDDGQSDAYTALGWISLWVDWDWPAARASFQEALDLNPNDTVAYHGMGEYLTVVGRVDEGTEMVRRGRAYDPMAPAVIWPTLGHLVYSGRYEEASQEARSALADQPLPVYWNVLSDAQWHLGHGDQALEAFREAWGWNPDVVAALDRGEADGGPRGAWRAVADVLAGGESAGFDRVASLYARAGEVDACFESLERAYRERRPGVLLIRANPDFRGLESDPRFVDLARRVGLPDPAPDE